MGDFKTAQLAHQQIMSIMNTHRRISIKGVNMNLHIAKWGNSLAVRIPMEYIRRTGLKEGDTVQASLTADAR